MSTYFTDSYAAVQQQLKVGNRLQIPRITQVTVNVGVGKKRQVATALKAVVDDLKLLTGQAPHERRARKAVSGFGVRVGELVGYRVTLRGKRMEDFVERLVKVALPRVRDFRGISETSFDGRGNLSLGLREQLPFPEIRADKTDVLFGVQVTLTTSAKTDDEAKVLLRSLGFPLTGE